MDEMFDFNSEGLEFEWDETDDSINYAKYGVHLKTAVRIFLDQYKLIRPDDQHPGENRYNVLGKVGNVMLDVDCVVSGDIVRLVAARAASMP